MSRRTLIGVAIALFVGCVIGLGAISRTDAIANSDASDQQPVTRYPRGNWDAANARAFERFPLYYAGEEILGLPLVAINRSDAPESEGEPLRRDDVAFLYGLCQAIGDAGCAPPLEIQVWNACERYRGLYLIPPDDSLRIRGVPAAFYDGNTRLELYSGIVTVVLFGESRDQLVAAAQGLRGLNHQIGTAADLPAPAKGVTEGKLACQG